MKAIVCEMCGSQDVIKKDGLYVCQSCETKYSIEEAKKLMVEGTIKIDNSEKLKNLYTAARNAKDSKDYSQAKSFYSEILSIDPNSWEALYYSVYCSVIKCKIFQIDTSANTLRACFEKTMSLIENHATNKEQAVKQIATETIAIAITMQSSALNHLNELATVNRSGFTDILGDYLVRTNAAAKLLFSVGDNIETDLPQLAIVAWEKGVSFINNYKDFYNRGSTQEQNSNNEIQKYASKIKKHTEEYIVPRPNHSIYNGFIRQVLARTGRLSTPQTTTTTTTSTTTNNGGCYVATAVYGSYNCPQVWTLRRYRDNTLAKTWYGRAFIRTYYAISPTLVKWFGHTGWFKKMWKSKLDRMVACLNVKGVEDTPYEDRNW